MNEVAIRKAVAHMARRLVRNGRPEDLLSALSEASPKVAVSHLRICNLDSTAAKPYTPPTKNPLSERAFVVPATD